MKQRISVRAIIQEDGKTLLLKRSSGRPSILGKYELPGGKLAYNEQPEDALRRYLDDDANLHVQNAQLFDAVTYIDYDDRSIQYAVIVYLVTLTSDHQPIALSGNYSKYRWQSMSNIHQIDITDLTELLLGIVRQDTLTDEHSQDSSSNDVQKTPKDSVVIFSDGGSRGNPGPSAAGYVIVNDQQEVLDEGGEYLGITTNNPAEYQAVRLGLERAIALGYKQVDFKIDSMLVVNQMKGLYKIKNRELWPINERIRALMLLCDRVTFTHVNREFNQLADGVVNKILNEHQNEQQVKALTESADKYSIIESNN